MAIAEKKVYFASDLHLGTPTLEASKVREKRFVRWLDSIKYDASDLFLVGDLFDFWFEYKTVVPRGYLRFFGKLIELKDMGVEISVFTGNHDVWMFDYFQQELDIPVYYQPITRTIGGKTFFIGHGDGLGPGDKGYKMLKKVFTNRVCQWLFARLHPNFAIGLANYFSRKSRGQEKPTDKYWGDDKEWLVLYSKRKLEQNPDIDYFIFGHRHIPLDIRLNDKSRYVNLGDWIKFNSYAQFDGQNLQLCYFEGS
ncbi:MAG: UDP-2,3-diacylglucosamine diphosphatase [Chitinophagales bacterium]